MAAVRAGVAVLGRPGVLVQFARLRLASADDVGDDIHKGRRQKRHEDDESKDGDGENVRHVVPPVLCITNDA